MKYIVCLHQKYQVAVGRDRKMASIKSYPLRDDEWSGVVENIKGHEDVEVEKDEGEDEDIE